MISEVARSLLWWAILGIVLVFSMKYIVSSFVLPGMDATGSLYNTDKYESYISENVAKK